MKVQKYQDQHGLTHIKTVKREKINKKEMEGRRERGREREGKEGGRRRKKNHIEYF